MKEFKSSLEKAEMTPNDLNIKTLVVNTNLMLGVMAVLGPKMDSNIHMHFPGNVYSISSGEVLTNQNSDYDQTR